MEPIKSINVKSVLGKDFDFLSNLNVPLIQIDGVAYGAKSTITKFGEQTILQGDFVAVNLLTGQVFESNAFFPFNNVTNELENRVSAANGEEVHFSLIVKATESDKNAYGYTIIADLPMTETRAKRQDALRAKALQVASTVKALPAPKTKDAA